MSAQAITPAEKVMMRELADCGPKRALRNWVQRLVDRVDQLTIEGERERRRTLRYENQLEAIRAELAGEPIGLHGWNDADSDYWSPMLRDVAALRTRLAERETYIATLEEKADGLEATLANHREVAQQRLEAIRLEASGIDTEAGSDPAHPAFTTMLRDIRTTRRNAKGDIEDSRHSWVCLNRVFMELTGQPQVDPNDTEADGWSPALREAGAATRALESLRARTLDRLQAEVSEWGEATFPTATPDSIFAHLRREIDELGDCDGGDVGEELADCLMLLIHLAKRYQVNLLDATRAKFEVNKGRTWGEPDAEGVIEHVREAGHAQQ